MGQLIAGQLQRLPEADISGECLKYIGSVEELAHSRPTLALSFPVEVHLLSPPPPKTASYRSAP
jgi:hypothetical protein